MTGFQEHFVQQARVRHGLKVTGATPQRIPVGRRRFGTAVSCLALFGELVALGPSHRISGAKSVRASFGSNRLSFYCTFICFLANSFIVTGRRLKPSLSGAFHRPRVSSASGVWRDSEAIVITLTPATRPSRSTRVSLSYSRRTARHSGHNGLRRSGAAGNFVSHHGQKRSPSGSLVFLLAGIRIRIRPRLQSSKKGLGCCCPMLHVQVPSTHSSTTPVAQNGNRACKTSPGSG